MGRGLLALFAVLASGALAAPAAQADVIHLLKPGLRLNTPKSTNWYGYDQGALEQGLKQFHSITGDWRVPTASRRTAGKAATGSTWVGIGGGCVDASCLLSIDPTLIQTGTQYDVSASGAATYSAWWELVPVPAVTIPSMPVKPGDHMHASIQQVLPLVLWRITLTNVTRNRTFTTVVPYLSLGLSAEWIQETPLMIGTDGIGLASLPNMTNTAFDLATTNGAPAQLKSSERILLTNNSGGVIGTPSNPDPDRDGFGLCTWATTCAVPGS